MMTIAELIARLQTFSPDTRVTLLDPDTEWMLKVQIKTIAAEDTALGTEFVAITGAYGDEEA
jgi:hypothetical protein